MATENQADLARLYEGIARQGHLPTPDHARRWTESALKNLGFNLNGRAKRALAKALPKPWGAAVTGIFWLIHFPERNLTQEEFLKRVARRAGNTDAEYARYPTLAVFGAVKGLIEDDLDRRVARALPEQVRGLWQEARPS